MLALYIAVTAAAVEPEIAWQFDPIVTPAAVYDRIEGDFDWRPGRSRFGIDAVIADSETGSGLPIRIQCSTQTTGGYFCTGQNDALSFRMALDSRGNGTIGQIRLPGGEALQNRAIAVVNSR